MINPRREQVECLLDAVARGKISRRALVTHAIAFGALGMIAPEALAQATSAGEIQLKNRKALKNRYDYIVVGAGSAGCAVARRLLDNTGATILVIEAGSDDKGVPEIENPTRWVENIASKRDWAYFYSPSESVSNRKILLSRGKVLGGSSSINALVWLRGNPGDYDGWAAAGARGWDWQSVLPHLKRMEDWEDGGTALRGAGGPTRVERAKDLHRVATALIDAGKDLGMPYIDDMNGETNLGVGPNNLNVRNGTRDNAFRAYLRPVMDNPRLTVLTEAKVTKLTLSATTCSGVEMLVDDGSAKIDADVEVILSAGAIDTPRLLMLSGIGPAADLKNVDIKTVVDAKGVGQNLQDHIILGGMIYETHEAMAPFNNNLEGSTFFAKSKSGLTFGDLMFVSVQIPYLMPELAALTPPPANSITIAPGLVRIGSRGYLKMLSNRHDGPMDIQPNMLKEQEDLDALVAGVELGQALAERPAFKEMIKSAVVPKINMTRAEKEEFVRASAATYFHPVGTCKMGVDDMSVVDPTLKVHGVEKLRIADASVMPNITGANTNVPSILIGEMAATFIAGL